MPFRAGFLTAADADRLNRLERQVAALLRFYAAPPLSVLRGTDGQIALFLNQAEEAGSGSNSVTIPVPTNIRCDLAGHIVWDLQYNAVILNPDGTLSQEVL